MKSDFVPGGYDTSFFHIHINSEKDFDSNLFSVQDYMSTLIHELIHYLQDLVLPYNIKLSLSKARGFKEVIDFAKNNGYIILDFDDNWSKEYSKMIKQSFLPLALCGKIDSISSVKKFDFNCVVIEDYNQYLGKKRNIEIYNHYMIVDNPKGETVYKLGAKDFLEYIAYKIEKNIYPDSVNAQKLPYESIDIIFDEKGFSTVSEKIKICVSEFCLYNDNPMQTLLHRLFKDKDFIEIIERNDYQEVYEFLMSYPVITFDYDGSTLKDIVLLRLERFANELKLEYNGFDSIVNWITRANDYIKNNCLGRFLFSDIYNMDKTDSKSFVMQIINEIGIPLISNSKYQYISIGFDEDEKEQFVQLYILQQFMKFLSSKSIYCPVGDLCKANSKNCYQKCKIKKGTIIGEKDCYYNRFLNNYGIGDLKYKKNTLIRKLYRKHSKDVNKLKANN